MPENNENERKRPPLYKAEEDPKKPEDKDVLKKLNDVRKNLQDSLDEKSTDKGEKGQKRKRGERRLYKADEVPTEKPPEKVKKVKPTKTVSKKRMALVQRRVKAKVDGMKGLSKKKKAIIVLWIVVATVPLFFLSSLAILGLEFDFTGVGIFYDETKPGTVTLTFPVRNPSILPAQLGIVTMDLYDSADNYIGRIYTDVPITIPSFQTKSIALTMDLTEETGGAWLAQLLDDLELELSIKSLSYNGITIPDIIPPLPPIPIGPILTDLISGLLDLEELLADLNLGDLLGGDAASNINPNAASSKAMTLDPYTKARKQTLYKRIAQLDDLLSGGLEVGFDFYEDVDRFEFTLDIDIPIGDLVAPLLGTFQLGPINVTNLDVQLYVNTEERYESSYDVKNDANAYKRYKTAIAKVSNTRPIEVYFDERPSKIGINFTIFKDDIGGAALHPSNYIRWDVEADHAQSIENFLAGTGYFDQYDEAYKDFPAWFFLYNLLSLGGLDCAIGVGNVDVNIFGLQMNGIGLDVGFLPPFYVDEGVLDPNNFFYKLVPNYGFAGILKNFKDFLLQGPALSLMGIPTTSNPGEMAPVDELLTSLTDMIIIPDISGIDIQESWGEGANLSVSLPLGINNTLFNIYVGLDGLVVGIGSEIDSVPRNFLELKVSGPNSGALYIPGAGTEFYMNLDVTIFKDEDHIPHVQKFIRELIEDFSFDIILSVNFTNLLLMKENYTFGAFGVALPLELSLGDMLPDLLGGIVPMISDMVAGGLVGGEEEAESSSLSNNPLSPASIIDMGLPTEALAQLLTIAPNIVPYSSQFLNDLGLDGLINDLLNTIMNDFVGDAIGIQMGLSGIGFGLEEASDRVSFIIDIYDLTVDTPITLGVGYTDVSMHGKDANGEWEKMVAIQIENYFEIKKNVPVSFQIKLVIHYTDALCLFVKEFLENGSMSLKTEGVLTLNLSGIYLENMNFELALEDVDTGINISEMLEGLIGGLADMELFDADEQGKPPSVMPTFLWDGVLNKIPFIAQGIDFDSLLSIGEISILDISESGWPNVDQGNVSIVLGLKLTNWLMGINLKKVEFNLFENATDKVGTALGKIDIVPGSGNLAHGSETQLQLRITLYKSVRLQNFLQKSVNTLSGSGLMDGELILGIFGCEFGPIYVPPVNLSILSLDLITGLLASTIPFAAPFQQFNPYAAQDVDFNSIFENVGQFALGDITASIIDNHVGPLNYTDPTLAISVGLYLQPKINLTVKEVNLELHDKLIFDALYEAGFSFDEIAPETKVAGARLSPAPCYFNTTNGTDPTTLDLSKPYVINGSEHDYENEIYDVEVIYDQGDPRLVGRTPVPDESLLNDSYYLPLNLSGMREVGLVLEVYNKSHGTWETRYNRKFWKALGGPYFPVQVYGKEYGGYPEHRNVYHKYFSPTLNLISGLTALSTALGGDFDIATVFDSIAIGGKIEINVFSMNLTIDLNNPVFGEMMGGVIGLLMDTTSFYLKDGVQTASNPLASYDSKSITDRYKEHLQNSQFDDIEVLLGGDIFDILNVDIFSFVKGFGIGSIAQRNDHGYVPAHGHDGVSVHSHAWEYDVAPEDVVDYYGQEYTGGLQDPYFTGAGGWNEKEIFYKDDNYNWFKTVVNNWMEDQNIDYLANPFFETHYTNEDGYMKGDPIEDPADWPLRWKEQERVASMVLAVYLGVLSNIPLSVLSARLSVWVADAVHPCDFFPLGYAFINNTVNIPEFQTVIEHYNHSWINNANGIWDVEWYYGQSLTNTSSPEFDVDNMDFEDWQGIITGYMGGYVNTSKYPHPSLDLYGRPDQNGPIIELDMRLFDSPTVLNLFTMLIGSLGGGLELDFDALPLFIKMAGSVNISVLGYEIYNVEVPFEFGDPEAASSRCLEAQQEGGGSETPWGIPGEEGYVEEAWSPPSEWPHKFLLGGGLFGMLGGVVDDIMNSLDGLFDAILAQLQTVLFDVIGPLLLDGFAQAKAPITLFLQAPIWIESITLTIAFAASKTTWDPYLAEEVLAIVPIEGFYYSPIMDYNGLDKDNPWNFSTNPFDGFKVPITALLGADLTMNQEMLFDLLGMVLRYIFAGWRGWIRFDYLELGIIFPAEFDNHFSIAVAPLLGEGGLFVNFSDIFGF